MSKISGLMKPLVTTMVPFSRNPSPEWCFNFASIMGPMNGSHMLTKTVNVDRELARTKLCEDAHERGSKFGFFLDDDVTVPPNIIRALLYELENAPDDVKVIGGIYTTKTQPAFPLVYQKLGEGPFYRWELGQVFECELIATGMMMFKLDIFKDMPQPWFKEIRTVEDGKKYKMIPEDYHGHDFSANDDGFFCHRVIQMGGKILAHGGMLGMHWDDKGTAYVLPDNSYPILSALRKKYGVDKFKTEEEYIDKLMALYRDAYCYSDFVPDKSPDLQKKAAGN